MVIVLVVQSIIFANSDDIFSEISDLIGEIEGEDMAPTQEVYFNGAHNISQDESYNYVNITVSLVWVDPGSVWITLPIRGTQTLTNLGAEYLWAAWDRVDYRLNNIAIPYNDNGYVIVTLDPANQIIETYENNNTVRIDLVKYTPPMDAFINNLTLDRSNNIFRYDVCFDNTSSDTTAYVEWALQTPYGNFDGVVESLSGAEWCRPMRQPADISNVKRSWNYTFVASVSLSANQDVHPDDNTAILTSYVWFATAPAPTPVVEEEENEDTNEEEEPVTTTTPPKEQPRNNEELLANAPKTPDNDNSNTTDNPDTPDTTNDTNNILRDYDLLSVYCVAEWHRIRSCSKLFDLHDLRGDIHELVSLVFLLLENARVSDDNKKLIISTYRSAINQLTDRYDSKSYDIETQTRLAFLFAYIDYSFALYETEVNDQNTYIQARTFFSQR